MPSDPITLRVETPGCSHHPTCPGCPRYGDTEPPPLARQRLTEFCEAAGIAAPHFHALDPMGYRHRARLSVRGRAASPKIGIFQAGSHRIVDIPHCRTHHPLVNRVCAAVKRQVRGLGIEPYADRPHRGELRGIQVVVERSSQTAQLVLIGNADTPTPLHSLAAGLENELSSELHSLWWNGNPDRTNTILGPHWHHYRGPEFTRESIGGATICFPPGAFGQSHLDLADRMVAQIADWVPNASRVCELYAGTGAIGLGLVEKCQSVAFNEFDSHSLSGLAAGRACLTDALSERVTIHPGPAEQCLELAGNADVVIVDPPRKGLHSRLRDFLSTSPPAHLIYASCDLDSFLRDARQLLASDRTTLEAVTAYSLLPFTHHIETLALYRRRSA